MLKFLTWWLSCRVYITSCLCISGENVDLLFIRTAALAFDQAVLREYEDMQNIGGKQQIGNTVISKTTTMIYCYTGHSDHTYRKRSQN